jgi:hypothetical protein
VVAAADCEFVEVGSAISAVLETIGGLSTA